MQLQTGLQNLNATSTPSTPSYGQTVAPQTSNAPSSSRAEPRMNSGRQSLVDEVQTSKGRKLHLPPIEIKNIGDRRQRALALEVDRKSTLPWGAKDGMLERAEAPDLYDAARRATLLGGGKHVGWISATFSQGGFHPLQAAKSIIGKVGALFGVSSASTTTTPTTPGAPTPTPVHVLPRGAAGGATPVTAARSAATTGGQTAVRPPPADGTSSPTTAPTVSVGLGSKIIAGLANVVPAAMAIQAVVSTVKNGWKFFKHKMTLKEAVLHTIQETASMGAGSVGGVVTTTLVGAGLGALFPAAGVVTGIVAAAAGVAATIGLATVLVRATNKLIYRPKTCETDGTLSMGANKFDGNQSLYLTTKKGQRVELVGNTKSATKALKAAMAQVAKVKGTVRAKVNGEAIGVGYKYGYISVKDLQLGGANA